MFEILENKERYIRIYRLFKLETIIIFFSENFIDVFISF